MAESLGEHVHARVALAALLGVVSDYLDNLLLGGFLGGLVGALGVGALLVGPLGLVATGALGANSGELAVRATVVEVAVLGTVASSTPAFSYLLHFGPRALGKDGGGGSSGHSGGLAGVGNKGGVLGGVLVSLLNSKLVSHSGKGSRGGGGTSVGDILASDVGNLLGSGYSGDKKGGA